MEVACRAVFEGKPCGESARYEVRFGGKFTIPLCDDHLDEVRGVVILWNKSEELEAKIHPVSAPEER